MAKDIFGHSSSAWKGGLTPHKRGYWRLKFEPFRDKLLHRVWFELRLGRALREDEEVEHTCHNPTCLNPGHWILMDAAIHHETTVRTANYIRRFVRTPNLFEKGYLPKRVIQKRGAAIRFVKKFLIPEKVEERKAA